MAIDLKTVWRMLERSHVGFLTTLHGEALVARPMALHSKRLHSEIYLLTSAASFKDEAIHDHPEVCLTAQHGGSYIAVSGVAKVAHNPSKVRELWTPFDKAWWDSPEDPDIRVLTITPREAHVWKTPGRMVAMVSMVANAVGDSAKPIGRDQRVPMM